MLCTSFLNSSLYGCVHINSIAKNSVEEREERETGAENRSVDKSKSKEVKSKIGFVTGNNWLI